MVEEFPRIHISDENERDYTRNLGVLFGQAKAANAPAGCIITGPLYQGKIEFYPVGRGMNLMFTDLQVNRDMEIQLDLGEPMVACALVLEGISRLTKDGPSRKSLLEFRTGRNVVGGYQAQKSCISFAGGRSHRYVDLQIDASRAVKLVEELEIPAGAGPASVFSPDSGRNADAAISPVLQYVGLQVLQCPLQGTARRLFMESKALEILAYELEIFSEKVSPPATLISREEQERLNEARRILEREFDSPPSLIQLARRVGLNDFKLKRGFRDLFGATVYGHVRMLRLDRARELLETGNLNVTEVASAIGYNSFGHFSAAFKKRFGILPSHFRKTYGSVK